MKAYLVSPEVKEKTRVVDSEKNRIALINEYMAFVNKAAEGINRADIINSKLLEGIDRVVPPAVTFKNSQFSGNQITLTGSAYSRVVVAEFYHNLAETGMFSNVNLRSLQAENPATGPFEFVITCTVKDVVEE